MRLTSFSRALVMLPMLGLLASNSGLLPAAANAATDPGRIPTLEDGPPDEETYYELVGKALEHQPVLGPVKGKLFHEPGEVTISNAQVSLSDFATHAECQSLIGEAPGIWDCGFEFRNLDGGTHYRLIVFSDVLWGLTIGNGDPIVKGKGIAALDESGTGMAVDLIVSGSKGYVAVNRQFISSFDVSEVPGPSSVAVGTAFFTDTFIEGGITTYNNFTVWSLE